MNKIISTLLQTKKLQILKTKKILKHFQFKKPKQKITNLKIRSPEVKSRPHCISAVLNVRRICLISTKIMLPRLY